jgi:hypothetical protein
LEGLRGALLWCMGFSGAFVFIEPSPYEIMGLLTMLVFALSGLSLRAAVAPLALALIIINVGYASSVVQVSDQLKPVTWVLISIFLALTAIFYAAMLGTNPQRRLELLLRGYVLGALVASAVAVLRTSTCLAANRSCSCSTVARAAPGRNSPSRRRC